MKFSDRAQVSAARQRAAIASLSLVFLAAPGVRSQASKPEPDTVVFPNGEKLIGHFEGFIGGSAKFKSDTMGEITIDLSKVQELRTSQKYAVIKKDVRLARGDKDGMIPLGTLTVTNKTVQVDPGGGKPSETIAEGDLGNVVDEASFHKAFGHPNILQDWGGEASVGVSLVEATQNSVSFNSSIALIRAIPTAGWLEPRNRSLLDFSDSYGKVTQPGTPEVKTSIFHAGAERDEYFSPRVYALGAVAFDHNFSQGLNLQQLYGGGFGWSVIHRDKESLDLKGSVDYEKQQFQTASQDQNLIDSVFSEIYAVKFAKGIALNEVFAASPAWNNTRAYSIYTTVGITFPVYKGFGFTANVIDSFLNDPPTGFKKNSMQFTTGLSYAIP
ncbi:MAG TPA: DUF481 domain-containing protein [Candidatus Sulfotelmatobacter sp.]|nr:DUF481 domain-containing protein [Candidatus Sulfotelmatobacter sp.]